MTDNAFHPNDNQPAPAQPEQTAEDWAALYVAGAMTSEEQAEFERRLANDDDLRAAVHALNGVSAALISRIAPVAPDASIRQQLLDRIQREADSSPVRDDCDDSSIVIQRAETDDWNDTEVPGVSMRVLSIDRRQQRMTVLLRMAAGSSYPSHVHDQDEECLLLEGDLDFGDYSLSAGDYLRVPAGSEHAVATTKAGCLCLIIAAAPKSLVA